jgi:hypothetical protein
VQRRGHHVQGCKQSPWSRGGKNKITSNEGGAPIIVVKLLRTDTTLDLSQKARVVTFLKPRSEPFIVGPDRARTITSLRVFVKFSQHAGVGLSKSSRIGAGSLIRLELLHLINFHQIIRMAPVSVISTPLTMMCAPNTAAQLLRPPVQIRPPKPSRIPHTYAVRRAVKQQSQAAASTNAQI